MLYFAVAERMQVCLPLPGMFEIFGSVLREKNVSGVTAIHYSLRDVDPGTCDVPAFVYVQDIADRSAVHAHAHSQLRILLETTANSDLL